MASFKRCCREAALLASMVMGPSPSASSPQYAGRRFLFGWKPVPENIGVVAAEIRRAQNQFTTQTQRTRQAGEKQSGRWRNVATAEAPLDLLDGPLRRLADQ